jgi:hypothetical protein
MQDVKIRKEKLDRHFNPILNKWIEMLNKYNDTFTENPPLYSYGERATVSTLAGAAWKCNNYVLQERSVHKVNEQKEYPGWTDLWIFCDDSTEYVIEAKELVITLPLQEPRILNLSKTLRKIQQEAESSKEDPNQIGLGIVFVVPKIYKSNPSKTELLITNFINQLEEEKCDILCYIFPEKARNVNEEDYFYPGVILLAQA